MGAARFGSGQQFWEEQGDSRDREQLGECWRFLSAAVGTMAVFCFLPCQTGFNLGFLCCEAKGQKAPPIGCTAVVVA